jgi:hypothetical protein
MSPAANRRGTEGAARCIGAQYVASLDKRAPGGIIEAPQLGTSMLFAKADESGRISLVRTGTVTRFETRDTVSRDSDASVPTRRGHDIYADPADRTQRIQVVPMESGVELTPKGRDVVASQDTPRAAARLHRQRR